MALKIRQLKTSNTALEVKARSQLRTRLGKFKPESTPRGYEIEVLPRTISKNSVNVEVSSKMSSAYTEFFIHLDNLTNKKIVATVKVLN